MPKHEFMISNASYLHKLYENVKDVVVVVNSILVYQTLWNLDFLLMPRSVCRLFVLLTEMLCFRVTLLHFGLYSIGWVNIWLTGGKSVPWSCLDGNFTYMRYRGGGWTVGVDNKDYRIRIYIKKVKVQINIFTKWIY